MGRFDAAWHVELLSSLLSDIVSISKGFHPRATLRNYVVKLCARRDLLAKLSTPLA